MFLYLHDRIYTKNIGNMKNYFLLILNITVILSSISVNMMANNHKTDTQGAVVSFNNKGKTIYLIFTADSAFEGAETILKTLHKNNATASFFLTGNCLRINEHKKTIEEIIHEGHYLGGHSDKHILYAPWDNRDQLLVTPDSLQADFIQNMDELSKFGINTPKLKYYVPPFEWYNAATVKLIEGLGQITINYTPGTRTAADYTTPDMKNYKSSQELINLLYAFEEQNSLSGAIILIHPGTHNDRTDKLYNRLDEIIKHLKNKGYSFEKLP